MTSFDDDSAPRSAPAPGAPGSAVRLLMWGLAIAGLLISGYLTYASTVTGTGPAGCGAGSGCSQVLASKWSRWLAMPVSGLAVAVYLVMLAALAAARSSSAALVRIGWIALVIGATAIAGAAVWFVVVQLLVIKAVCPYCMADHACGAALAVLVFCTAPYRRSKEPKRQPPVTAVPVGGSIALGLIGVAAMIAVQWRSEAAVHRVDLPTDQDYDQIVDGARHVSMLGGELKLALADEPLIGSAQAKHVIAMMFDYACPHCRHTHHVINALKRDRYRDDLTIIALPVPLNRKCNPRAPEELAKRFDESCQLAKIALAVFLANPSEFEAFDAWMFDPPMPRTAAAAQAQARQRVGGDSLERALADPRIAGTIERNVTAYGRIEERRVPVVMAPQSKPIIGRIEEAQAIIDLVEDKQPSN